MAKQLKKPTVKNPKFVDAMAEFKQTNTPAAEKAMIEELKQAQLIAPVLMDDIPDDVDLSDGKQYQMQAKFMMLQQKNGDRYFPAFTDWLEVLKWRNDPDIKTVLMTLEQYTALMSRSGEASGLVINPSEQGLALSRQKISEITGATLPPSNGAYRNEPLPDLTVNPKTAFADAAEVSNPQLVGAVAAFRKQSSRETEGPMLNALFQARLIAPVQLLHPEDEAAALEDGEQHQTQIQFVMVQNNGKKFFPVFTDLEEMERWNNPPEYRTMILPFLQFASMFQQNNDVEGLVLNPFRNGESLAMPKQQVIDLAKQFLHQQRQRQQQAIQLFELKNKPLDLMRELKEHFESVPEVHAAYMTGMRVAGKESIMLVLDCDEAEDNKAVFQPAAQIVNKYTNGNPPGIITSRHTMGKKIMEEQPPFYQE